MLLTVCCALTLLSTTPQLRRTRHHHTENHNHHYTPHAHAPRTRRHTTPTLAATHAPYAPYPDANTPLAPPPPPLTKPQPPKPPSRSYQDAKTLWRLTVPDLPLLCAAFCSLILASIGEVLMPQIQSSALNLAITGGANAGGRVSPQLVAVLARLGGVGGATALATGLRGFLFWLCGARLVLRLRRSLFESLLAKPQAFHDERAPGELGSRLSSDCIKLGDVLTLNVNIVLRQLVQTVGGLFFVWRIHPRLSMLLLGGVVARSCLSAVYGSLSRAVAVAQQNALAEASATALQGLTLVQTVRAYGAQLFEARRYGSRLRALSRLQTRQGTIYGASRVGSGALNVALLCAVFAAGGSLVASGTLPAQALTSLILYTEFVSSASSDIGDQWARVQEALGAATDVFRLLDAPAADEVADDAAAGADGSAAAAADAAADLSLDGVSFRYPSRETAVLSDVSIKARKGEMLAIVGGSGSGKSTVLKMALRLYDPDAGAVRLGGRDLTALTDAEVRSTVAWVQQEPPLFPVTIGENIAYGLSADDPLADGGEVERAARAANCHGFISALPQKYDTVVGANGAALSGGQRQRIAIARALLRRPSVLLLDEATSALDPESARLVQAALHSASSECAVVLTTHKLDQAALADRIVCMCEGNVVEEGTHAELVARRGYYYALSQQGSELDEDEDGELGGAAAKGTGSVESGDEEGISNEIRAAKTM